MRRTIYSLLMLLSVVFTACHKDILNDIDGLKGDVADLQTRVEALEAQCKQMNSDITTLQTLIAALQQNDMISSIAGNETEGYTITFVSGKVITLKSGTTGADGNSPVIGAKQDSDGIYYWTLDGEFLKDADGNALPVTGTDGAAGVTPSLQIDDNGYWQISYDDGATWTTLGQATGDTGETGKRFFEKFEFTESSATITLADGTKLILPRTNGENDHTLTYDANGGEGTMVTENVWSQRVITTVKDCAFTRMGYTFLTWNTQPDGTGITYAAGSSINLKENTTLYAQWLDIRFSIISGRKVLFAPGNLQYQASTNTWRFAEHQYDYIGDANSNISSTYAGWIDLFGWGTATNPTNTSILESDYTFTDQGTNVIGDYPTNTWRTLSKGEWEYIIKTRTNASSLFGFAKVNGIKGLILLPDSWTTPNGITFNAGTAAFTNNVYTITQWQQMEVLGAVFLPAAGFRYEKNVNKVQLKGNYWSSTENGASYAYILNFGDNLLEPQVDRYRCNGHSVRLVREL